MVRYEIFQLPKPEKYDDAYYEWLGRFFKYQNLERDEREWETFLWE